jgi:hypothetical protein
LDFFPEKFIIHSQFADLLLEPADLIITLIGFAGFTLES